MITVKKQEKLRSQCVYSGCDFPRSNCIGACKPEPQVETPETDAAKCLVCGQKMLPTDIWERRLQAANERIRDLEKVLAIQKRAYEMLGDWVAEKA